MTTQAIQLDLEPRTVLGKKVKNKDALSNPDSLFQYENLQF